jgi:hypothetical protein
MSEGPQMKQIKRLESSDLSYQSDLWLTFQPELIK